MDHVPSARQHDADARGPSGLKRGLFLAFCLALAAGFGALGAWQVERLVWKRALIRTVEARLAAAPAPPPAWDRWSPDQAYGRVVVRGVFLHDRETLVQAVTARGPGFWVMTPLRTDQGVVLINRGFVPPEQRAASRRAEGQTLDPVVVTGLLRASEPQGGFLRANSPGDDRWYSRDVAAIGRARGGEPLAPFFVDADAASNAGGWPVGGLTVVRFSDNHLVYALTWFGLAGLCLLGAGLLLRRGRGR